MSTLFFSVVIPIYNKEPHISRSIKSVLNQTFDDFELILVCDPSTDNSNAEVKKFTDPRIRVLYRDKPGPGGYAARNLGVKEAKAQWIAFLDADDEWYSEHLEKMRQLSFEFKDAKIMSSAYEISYPSEIEKKYLDAYGDYAQKKGSHLLTFEDYLKAEVSSRRPIWTTVACIKKDVLLAVGGFPEGKVNIGGDVDTWLRCIEFSNGLAWSDYIGAVYFRDSVNMVTKSEWSDASFQRETIKRLMGKYSGNIIKLLKSFSNRRTRGSWILNLLHDRKNFNLISKMYLDVLTLKDLKIILMSFLPYKIVKFIVDKVEK